MTKDNAQRIWDDARDEARQLVMRVLWREAAQCTLSSKRRASQNIMDHAEKATEGANVALAAMVLLGAENVDEIRQLIEKGG